MGKIYRIHQPRSRDFLKLEYRSLLALCFWVVLLISVGMTMGGLSWSGDAAIGLLLTPMLSLLTLSTLQVRFPKTVTSILFLIAALGLVVAVGSLIYSVVWLHWLADLQACRSWCGFDADYVRLVRGSISQYLIEFLPLTLTIGIYIFALKAQIRCAFETWELNLDQIRRTPLVV